jgi:hypothetical protein
MKKSLNNYKCELCNYNTCKKSDYNKHILTRKHKMATIIEQKNLKKKNETVEKNYEYDNNIDINKNLYLCSKCGKCYKVRNSYWYHKQKCNSIDNEYNIISSNNPLSNNVLELMKENKKLKDMMIDQNKQIFELANKIGNISESTTTNNTTNNTINNKFNLTVFLNEQCKDAINIEDFVDSLQIHLKDLENTKDQGLVNSISNILINGLNKLDISKRPIHCTDIKRDVLYIKDEEKWEKDQQKNKIKQSINEIANKQRIAINQWTEANPNWMENEELKDEYVKLVNHLMHPVEDTEKEQNKIIKKVSAATTIEK